MKTEELKALGLNDEQVQKVFAMNGADIERKNQTITTLTTERDAARTQLGEANKKLEGYDPDWKSKAEKAENDAKAQVAELHSEFAAQTAVSALKFSSESAKKAFLADLKAKNCPCRTASCWALTTSLPTTKRPTPALLHLGIRM